MEISPRSARGNTDERLVETTRRVALDGIERGLRRQTCLLDAATDAYIDRFPLPEKIACGSALKFGLLAEGSADLYPRLGPTSEWDIAAGHAVLVAAGGELRKPDGGALRYGQGDFRVPGFIATGDVTQR